MLNLIQSAKDPSFLRLKIRTVVSWKEGAGEGKDDGRGDEERGDG